MKKIISDRISTIIENIAKDFSISKISRSPARFNTEKLNWFNREYLKVIGLNEFVFRASKLRLNKHFEGKNLRVGDYVYLIDPTTQKVFCNYGGSKSGQDGMYYMLGGGRDEGETSIQGLVREVNEETFGKLIIDESKLRYIDKVQIIFENGFDRDDIHYDGKEMNFYYYEVPQDSIAPYNLFEDNEDDQWPYEWHNLSDVIISNQYLNISIWNEFCESNELPCLELTPQLVTQYQAWSMDKSRVTLLSEFGMDSDCILNFVKSEPELLKWKKITLEESLANLQEIKVEIMRIYDLLQDQRTAILGSDIDSLPNLTLELSSSWELELKKWIENNNKDAGSYFWPLRTALSGKAKSPSPFEILAVLNKVEIEKRLS